MKKLLGIALALVLVLGMAANASALTVAFSQIGQESDWRTANTDNVCAAIEAQGWELVYADAQQKQENQVQALRSFITQGVDYILFTGVVSTGWDEVLKEVNEAEIPLILLDRIPSCVDDIEYAAAFGGDFVEEGKRMVRWLANYLEKEGRGEEEVNIVMLEGTTGADAQVGRSEGILAELENHPNMTLVESQTGNFTRAEGQQVMETFLNSIDDIDVLLAQNDDMALGAIEAIKSAGLKPGEDIIIIGCDSVKAAFEAIVAGEMNCTVECTPLYADFLIPTIEGLEAGETYGRDIIHPEEYCYDAEGGIPYTEDGETLSIKAADVIDERLY